MAAQPNSNANGSRHPERHGSERYAARHGPCRTVKDRLEGSVSPYLGSKWLFRGPGYVAQDAHDLARVHVTFTNSVAHVRRPS